MMRVSHETIYQSLFVQTKGTLKAELTAHLRTQRTRRKAQTGGAKRVTLGITEDIRISAGRPRPSDRPCPGTGRVTCCSAAPGKGAVITLVERSSRFVLLAPLPGRHTAELARMSLAEMIATLPLSLRQSITWDRGYEMAQHAQFKTETGCRSTSATPSLLGNAAPTRTPTGCCASTGPRRRPTPLTQTECDDVALTLNTTTPKTLEWKTPAQVLNTRLVATTS